MHMFYLRRILFLKNKENWEKLCKITIGQCYKNAMNYFEIVKDIQTT